MESPCLPNSQDKIAKTASKTNTWGQHKNAHGHFKQHLQVEMNCLKLCLLDDLKN
jgi:hypothetical protein